MAYQLGVDLGTTWTAAAVYRDGQERPEVLTLGSTASAVASVVFLAPDGTLVLGEAAQRRALTEPRRVAREFKRRIGDDTPLMVGGEPMAADELSARFVAWVVDEAQRREGGPADAVVVTHPAEWGEHKRTTFAAALAGHGLGAATFLTEPQAAAVGYASAERIAPGAVVGVYDLGGGTFDAAVVRKLPGGGFELLGHPAGIERLGGIDFDDAILEHVRTALGPTWAQLDATDPSVRSAVAGLRRECTAAKEALSADTEVMVPVMLPGTHMQVRLGRADFEDMIRPSVGDTVEALLRAVASAGFTAADLDAVLLVGGSSRIPLVAQMVSAELGRAISVDADPKSVVATGAALFARGPLPAAAAEPGPGPAPARPPVPVGGPPADPRDNPRDSARDGAPRRRSSRTLVVAASVAVLATLGISAAVATGVGPPPVGTTGEGVPLALAPPAAVRAEVDPWTGTAPAVTTTPGPRRAEAVAAPVRPVARTSPTGAAGASAAPRRTGPGTVPRPAAVPPAGPAAPVPQPGEVAPGGQPGSGTEGTGATDPGPGPGDTGTGTDPGGTTDPGTDPGGGTGGTDPVDPPAGGSEDGTPTEPPGADPSGTPETP